MQGLGGVRRTVVRVTGVRDDVQIVRECNGVPHVLASSPLDAAFGQGFVHVEDRWWQMELLRHVAAGRTAELFGAAGVDADRFARRLGLRRAALEEVALLDHDEHDFLAAYSAGVNAAFAHLRHRRPVELHLVRLRSRPWTVVDSLACLKAVAFSLSADAETELVRVLAALRVGGRHAASLLGVPHAERALADLTRLLGAYASVAPGAGGSNAWAIAGSRTASGFPLLAGDPHLPLGLPPSWHEVRLKTPEFDAFGIAAPGIPGILMGHTRRVAWATTNAFADTQDLVLERFAEDGVHYRTESGWEPAASIAERIAVRGGAKLVESVRITRHGPVLVTVDESNGNGGAAFALRWTGLRSAHTVRALLRMLHASDVAAFRGALADWSAPAVEVVFADRNSIGRALCGAIPARSGSPAGIPVVGWNEDSSSDTLAFDALPYEIDPPCGYVFSANAPAEHPAIRFDGADAFRAQRIERLLSAAAAWDVGDMLRAQCDVDCEPGRRLAARCAALAPSDSRERAALAVLRAWDGLMSAESAGAAVYAAVAAEALRLALEPALGYELFGLVTGSAALPLPAGGALAGRFTSVLDAALRRASDEHTMLARALTGATALLRTVLGDDIAAWSWGRLHRLRLRHRSPLAAALGGIVPDVDVGLGGGHDTVFQTGFLPARPFAVEGWAPSWRFVADLGDPDRSVSALPGGESGDPASPHLLDLLDEWLRGSAHAHRLDGSPANHERTTVLRKK